MKQLLEAGIATVRAQTGDGEQAPPGIALGVRTPETDAIQAEGERGSLSGEYLPLTPQTHYDVASVTKAVATTASLMRLVDAGALTLDQPVREILPTASVSPETTVRHVLQHRAGLWEWWPLYLAPGGQDAPYDVADSVPLRYQPDTERHYSDLGFILLGRIVESVAGEPLPAAVDRLVLEPLGMTQTRYAHPVGSEVAASGWGDGVERRMIETGVPYPVPFDAAKFPDWRDHTLIGEVDDGNAFHALRGVSGHAGLFSTLGDLLLFGAAMAEPGDGFVSAAVKAEFFAAGPDNVQALGFRRYTVASEGATHELLGHPGFTGCMIGWEPGTGRAFALGSNRMLVQGTPVLVEKMWLAAVETIRSGLNAGV